MPQTPQRNTSYEYQMEHVPVSVDSGPAEAGGELAQRLQDLANEKAAGGWELHRTDTFDAKVPMGCLSAGAKEEREYVIATFRRPKA